MTPSKRNPYLAALPLFAFCPLVHQVTAADRWWDGGSSNLTALGNGVSAGGAGTWNTTLTNWDQGSGLAPVAWVNANNDNAIFGGTSTAAKTITIASGVTVQVNTLIVSQTGYTFGGATAGTGTIQFTGSYGDSTPTIDTTAGSSATSATFNSKITGTLTGGLVVKDINLADTPTGRVYLNAASGNDFIGDITILSGNLHMFSNLGNANNKIILKGGGLYGNSGTAIEYIVARDIVVQSNSHIYNPPGLTTGQVMSVGTGKTITGTGNLLIHQTIPNQPAWASEVRFQGDMSGYSGTITNRSGVTTIQSTATSAGAWIINGGTLRFNTSNDTHIINGSGKADLILNGNLDLNGKSETINGLSGTSGFVQNQAASTTSTLTFGDADATATFSGAVRNNSGSGGTVALTKIGTGTQSLTGTLTHTGATSVSAGTLLITNATGTLPTELVPAPANSAFTLANSATLGVQLTGTGPASVAMASLTTGNSGAGSTLALNTRGFGLLTSTPMIKCLGSLAPGADATTLIKINGYNFSTGQFSLMQYGSLDGAGFTAFDVRLPYRVQGTLVNNTTDPLLKSVDLNITSAETAVWTGEAGGVPNGNWDINPDADGSAGTFNWKTSVGGTATRYAQGPANTDQATFDDSATGTTTVTLTTTLAPRHLLVNNTIAKTYTFTGSGKISGETQLEKDSDGTLIIANTAVNDHTGGTLIRGGILRLGDGATAGAGRLSGSISLLSLGTLAFFHPEAVTITNPISGAGAVLKLGTNTLTLNAAGSYSGGTTISTGTIAASTATALGTGIVILGDAATGSEPLELTINNRSDLDNAIYVSDEGTGPVILSASNTGTGSTDPATFKGTVTLDRATTFRSDITGDALAFTGKITSSPPALPGDPPVPVTLTVSGGKTVSMESTANDFTGEILVRGAGTSLQAKTATGSEVIPDSVSVDLATDTFLKLAVPGAPVETISRLTGTGIVERPITGTQTLAVGSGNANSTFDGVIRNGTGSVALRKVGSGTFTLTNTHSYTGTTGVLEGTVIINGVITSTSTVNGGTLSGTGTVGAINALGSGKISPGTNTTIGTLSTTGNVSFATGTEYTAQINSNGTPSCDRLAVTGTLALGAGVSTLHLTDLGSATLTATTKLVLATATGAITGTFKDTLGNPLPNDSNVVLGSNTYKLKYNDTVGALNAITLTYTASGYGSWASTNGVGSANVDHDNDGVPNGVEYVLGTDPKTASKSGITTTVTPTEFQFSFSRSDASETPDTVVTIEVSNDLGTWTANGSPFTVGATSGGSITVVENPDAPAADPGKDTVTLTVPRDTTTKFARIKVLVTP